MRIHWQRSALALICVAAMACSSSSVTPDDFDEFGEPTDGDFIAEDDGDFEADEVVFEPDVPEFRQLSFSDGEPEVVDGEEVDGISSFRVGNVDVIHMPTPANEVVAARLYLRGGSANLDEQLAGIEQLALSVAVNGGTESTPKDEFNARLDAIGSSVGSTTNRDFSGITMRSVRDHFDETWELFMESVFEPAFEADEVELRRDRQLASIKSIVDNPDRLVSEVARDLIFADHPYYFRQIGTQDTVSQFTAEQLRAWQRHLIAPERMLLVVVGNIERDDLVDKVKTGLGRLAPTGVEVPALPGISPDKPALRVEHLDLPTNYILGYYSTPSIDHEDYPALVLGTQHLRDRLFEEVRTKRNLTYAVSSGIGQRGDNVGFLYVTAVDPGATMPVIFDEVERLQTELVDAGDLEQVRNVYLTRHYQGLETNASIAGQLGRAELIGGDWTRSQRFLDDINEVTPEDIRRVAQTYMSNYQFGVVGDPDDVPPKLFGVQTDQVETVDEIDDSEVEDAEEMPQAPPEAGSEAPAPEQSAR